MGGPLVGLEAEREEGVAHVGAALAAEAEARLRLHAVPDFVGGEVTGILDNLPLLDGLVDAAAGLVEARSGQLLLQLCFHVSTHL